MVNIETTRYSIPYFIPSSHHSSIQLSNAMLATVATSQSRRNHMTLLCTYFTSSFFMQHKLASVETAAARKQLKCTEAALSLLHRTQQLYVLAQPYGVNHHFTPLSPYHYLFLRVSNSILARCRVLRDVIIM